jgi:hypothetical protein
MNGRGLKKGAPRDDKKEGMERIEPKKEEWVFLATDDDGTQAYMDMAGVSVELDEAALFKVWLKHVPPPGSKTFGEIQRLLTKNRRGLGAPHHVKQVLEIDCFKGVSRNISLVVCDKKGQILHVVHYRFPEWVDISDGTLLGMVKKNVQEKLSDAGPQESKPLSFVSPKPSIADATVTAGANGTNGNGTEVPAHISSEAVPFTGKLRLEPHGHEL